ncbi:MAG: site-specific integrase, partial [Ktedonobacteraceae bacterium]|nr:site-specific integrase [Ktedonobacteraceae bacterium]
GKGQKARYIETEPKTIASRRTITLPQFVVDLLHLHRTKQIQVHLKARSTWREQDLVFTTRHGTHYSLTSLHKQFLRLLTSARLPRMRFHDLRHSAATILLGLGVNIKVIQELLGHSDITITLNLYSHVIPGMHKEAMGTLDHFYQQAQ